MIPDVTLIKKKLREQLRARLELAFPPARRESSLNACALLRNQAVWQQAKRVLFYSPLHDEINLLPLLEEALTSGKQVALPGFIAETGVYGAFEIQNLQADCVSGKFGILEPGKQCPKLQLNQLDLVLVPGVGFDPDGHRLGRGRGFYDRLLAQVTGMTCGIAFDEQITTEIPVETHDVKLNFILTPTRWLSAAPQGTQFLQ